MKRVPAWPARLAAFVHERRGMAFCWGSQDCAQLVRAEICAITGLDPAAGWGLPAYRTALGAARALRAAGSLAALPGRAGLEEIPVAAMGRGDVALVELGLGGRGALVFCTGTHLAGAGREGIEFHPRAAARRAWRVG